MQIRKQPGEDGVAGIVAVVGVGDGRADAEDRVVARGVAWTGAAEEAGLGVPVRVGVALAGLVAEPGTWLEFTDGLDMPGVSCDALAAVGMVDVPELAGPGCCPPEDSVRATAMPAPATTQPPAAATSQALRRAAPPREAGPPAAGPSGAVPRGRRALSCG